MKLVSNFGLKKMTCVHDKRPVRAAGRVVGVLIVLTGWEFRSPRDLWRTGTNLHLHRNQASGTV